MKYRIAILCVVVSLACEKRDRSKTIVFNNNLIAVNDRANVLTTWVSDCAKIVVFQDTRFEAPFRWRDYMEKYPDIRFIYMFVSSDEAEIERWLEKSGMNGFPVFWDIKNQFLKENNFEMDISFVAFTLDKSNKMIALTNPTIPNFEASLKSLLQDCK
jgi:hypothetical protein